MKTKTNQKSSLSKLKVFLFLFSVFWLSESTYGQSSGILFFWDRYVGCQEFFNDEDPRGTKEPIFIEEIVDGICLKVCENSQVTYTLSGNLGSSFTTDWTVAGGTILSQTNTSCTVKWLDEGFGSIGFLINTPTGTTTKTLCIEKVIIPIANFSVVNGGEIFAGNDRFYTCADQEIHFTNLSTANNGTGITSYVWEFGDGTFSSEFEPSHTYAEDGTYTVYLTVYNSCSCSSKKRISIEVNSRGFDIVCPGVVCEDQTSNYSLPFDGREMCTEITARNWDVDGGSISNIDANGSIDVTWNHVGSSGFGYVTFLPNGNCSLSCRYPTTLKIPVIQKNGTIQGSSSLCNKGQGFYKLPEWPTTDFNWYIVGNEEGNLAEVILTDQRNEVIIKPLTTGILRLKCDYQNTLLHCGGSAEFLITVNESIDVEGPEAVCVGSTGTYTTTGGGLVKWILKNSTGTIVEVLENSTTYTYSFHTIGNYSLSVESELNCVGQPKSIVVEAAPSAPQITGATEICPNSPYVYQVIAPDVNSFYYWSVTNGTILTSPTGSQITVSFTNAATHSVSVYRVTQLPAECTSAITSLQTTKKTIQAAVDGINLVCPNTNQSYEAIIPSTTTLYTEGDTYTWSLDNPSLGSITSGQGTNAINVLWNNVTVPTTVVLQVQIAKCTLIETFTKEITITPQPVLSISGTDSLCSGNYGYFTLNAAGFTLPSNSTIVWNFGNGTLSTSDTTVSQYYISNASTNITKLVTASYTNPLCGSTVTSEPFEVTILPGPGANISISGGSNRYCSASEINTELTAATTPGAQIEWYKVGSSTPLSSASSYTVSAFGSYYIKTTLNGCVSISNYMTITQYCPVSTECTLSPEPIMVNNSINDCGVLLLSGSTNITPISSSFDVLGGPTNVVNYTGSTLEVEAGAYHVYYKANNYCLEGPTVEVKLLKEVVVPYIPKFNYSSICNDNNSFTITVLDNSDVYTQVTGLTYSYYYRIHNASGSNPWIAVSVDSDGTLAHSFSSGLYDLKLVLSGYHNGGLQPACEKVIESIALQTLPNSLAVTITDAPLCHDTAVGFLVTGSSLTNSYVWTFDADAENTLAAPFRVFNDSGSQTVSVAITNPNGCSITRSTPLVVPEKCFNGDVVAVPANATVCSGESVLLSYQPNNDECEADSYQWMNGNTVIAGATQSTLAVTQTGFYWVKVYSADNCLLETSSRISPVFKPQPTVNLNSNGTFCFNTIINVSAVTTATVVGWTLNGSPIPYSAGYTTRTLPALPVGNHTVGITVTTDGCSTVSATHDITIIPLPSPPEVSYYIEKCEPFSINLFVTNPETSGVYGWSNGIGGPAITVTNGGVYEVLYNNGSCTNKNQLVVPKNPQDYAWIFPKGCVSSCNKVVGTLIGPRTPLVYWGWVENGVVEEAGENSFTEPYVLDESGHYQFSYLTTPGGEYGVECPLVTAPLDYQLTDCDGCGFTAISLHDISRLEELRYCAFNTIITLTNSHSQSMNVTIGTISDAVIVQPSTVTLNPGVTTLVLTLIPINDFDGGAVSLFFTSFVDGKPCMNELEVIVPSCSGEGEGTESKTQSPTLANPTVVTLYPNPAKESVILEYTGMEDKSNVTLFDLTGRSLYTESLEGGNGKRTLLLSNYPSGIYLVVVHTDEGVVAQRKLVIE